MVFSSTKSKQQTRWSASAWCACIKMSTKAIKLRMRREASPVRQQWYFTPAGDGVTHRDLLSETVITTENILQSANTLVLLVPTGLLPMITPYSDSIVVFIFHFIIFQKNTLSSVFFKSYHAHKFISLQTCLQVFTMLVQEIYIYIYMYVCLYIHTYSTCIRKITGVETCYCCKLLSLW